MSLTIIVILLLVASAAATAHHKDGHDGGPPDSHPGKSSAANEKVQAAGNPDPAPTGVNGNGNGNPAKKDPPPSPPQESASNAASAPQNEVEPPVEQTPDPEPEPPVEPVGQQPPATPQGSGRPEAVVESVDENPSDAPGPDAVDETVATAHEPDDPSADASVDDAVEEFVDDAVNDVTDSGSATKAQLEDPVPATRGTLTDDEGTPQEPATTTHDDAPRSTGGGGGIRLDVDVKDKVATSSPDLPSIGISYWVDDDVIHLLADPVSEDDDLSGLPQYEWLWPDGTTTIGGAFQTHRISDGMEQYIVTVIRLDEDGIATHENTEWIDLTFYDLHATSTASQYGPTKVHALGEEIHPATPKKNSDIGAAIESVPAPPLVPVLGLLGMVAWWRRRG